MNSEFMSRIYDSASSESDDSENESGISNTSDFDSEYNQSGKSYP